MRTRRWRGRSLFLATCGLAAAACVTDPLTGVGRPAAFKLPTGVMAGADPTFARVGGELGGRAAMLDIASRAGDNPSDPDLRATLEMFRKLDARPSRANNLISGAEYYDGDYFLFENGEAFPPAGKTAKIYSPRSVASKLDDVIDVDVTFGFDGTGADNHTSWEMTESSTGQTLSTHSDAPTFGSPNFNWFSQNTWSANSSEYNMPCAVTVKGNSRHTAWYGGWWELVEISLGFKPNEPAVNTRIVRGGHSGAVDAGTRLDTYFTCPPPDPGYGGGDPECWECQQWFYFFGDVWWEEWECTPTDPSACQADEM